MRVCLSINRRHRRIYDDFPPLPVIRRGGYYCIHPSVAAVAGIRLALDSDGMYRLGFYLYVCTARSGFSIRSENRA